MEIYTKKSHKKIIWLDLRRLLSPVIDLPRRETGGVNADSFFRTKAVNRDESKFDAN